MARALGGQPQIAIWGCKFAAGGMSFAEYDMPREDWEKELRAQWVAQEKQFSPGYIWGAVYARVRVRQRSCPCGPQEEAAGRADAKRHQRLGGVSWNLGRVYAQLEMWDEAHPHLVAATRPCMELERPLAFVQAFYWLGRTEEGRGD